VKFKTITTKKGAKYVPPGGDRYQPHELGVEISAELEEGDDPKTCLGVLRQMAKEEIVLQKKECI
jgi:hypothetical protein